MDKKRKPYVLALDVGTGSVGYACMYRSDYKLPSKKMKVLGNTDRTSIKKNLMGTLLFDSADTAAGRRLKRTSRRRLSRRRKRLLYLQEIFGPELAKLDENFLHRLDDSFLKMEDKRGERHPIFGNVAEEVAYHDRFPTIYHLRQHLADSKEKADLRLIYLALAHILKFRGHFLIEGELDMENNDIQVRFDEFLASYDSAFETSLRDQDAQVAEICKEKISKSAKKDRILAQFPSERSNSSFAEWLKLCLGNQADFKKVFGLAEKTPLQFLQDGYEEDLENLLAQVGDDYTDVFWAAKNFHDAILLAGILSDQPTKAPLSAFMIKRYKEHEEDLKALKAFIRQHLPEKYKEVFSDETKNGYAGYIESGVKQEDFYKYLKNLLQNVPGSEVFLEKIKAEDFLRKQRTFDNGAIPHQVHLQEMRAILRRQAPYYPFLQEKQDKLEKLLTFRIPYYVGPLDKGNSPFAWLVRNSEESITPWNFEDVVNKEESAQKFIERMTNVDLYLPDQKVLPKHSLLYEKYAVYNELTKIQYVNEQNTGHYFAPDWREKIVEDLFKSQRKVTKRKLLQFLENIFTEERVVDIRGLDEENQTFNASLGTYHDLQKILSKSFLDDPENEEILEELIHILTIFEDREMIHQQLSKYQGILTEKEIKDLSRRHYTGWGRLSRKLIHGIRDKKSKKTILDYLMTDQLNRNFQQLITDDHLSFKQRIEEAQQLEGSEDLKEMVQGLAGSPAIKKGILQSLRIVNELIAVMGYKPESIVIEMARETQTTKRGRRNAKPRLKQVAEALGAFGSESILKKRPTDNQELQNDRMYLYYLQNGKDMYTGEELDFEHLSSYDIDHIIPQSFIKDDSLDNRVLVSQAKNRGKSDEVPSLDVVRKMKSYWELLLKAKLVGQRKFDYLTKAERKGLTERDKARFIQRQLVETRQITKHIARILDQMMNSTVANEESSKERVKIITLKSSLVSQFRKENGLYKVREINDYHHAHDAYLNAVVATALLKKYPQLAPEFVYGEYHKKDLRKLIAESAEGEGCQDKATAKYFFYSNIMNFFKRRVKLADGRIIERPIQEVHEATNTPVWNKETDLATVRKVLSYPQVNVVKKREVQRGGFSKESILPKGESDKLIPRKTKDVFLDPKKYGGFDSPVVAYTLLVVADIEKGKKKKTLKTVKEFVGITIMEAPAFEKDPVAFLEQKGYQNVQKDKIFKLPKYSLFEFENGRRRLLASARELQKGNQMFLPLRLSTLLYHAKHIEKRDEPQHVEYVRTHRKEFKDLLDYISAFASNYISAETNLVRIQKTAEKMDEMDDELLAASFVNLLTFTAFGAPADFDFLHQKIARKRYTSLTECLNATLIHQSITGLYEIRIDLRKLGGD